MNAGLANFVICISIEIHGFVLQNNNFYRNTNYIEVRYLDNLLYFNCSTCFCFPIRGSEQFSYKRNFRRTDGVVYTSDDVIIWLSIFFFNLSSFFPFRVDEWFLIFFFYLSYNISLIPLIYRKDIYTRMEC